MTVSESLCRVEQSHSPHIAHQHVDYPIRSSNSYVIVAELSDAASTSHGQFAFLLDRIIPNEFGVVANYNDGAPFAEKVLWMSILDIGQALAQFDAPLSDVVLMQAVYFLFIFPNNNLLDSLECLLACLCQVKSDLKSLCSQRIHFSIGESRQNKLSFSVRGQRVDFDELFWSCDEIYELIRVWFHFTAKSVTANNRILLVIIDYDVGFVGSNDKIPCIINFQRKHYFFLLQEYAGIDSENVLDPFFPYSLKYLIDSCQIYFLLIVAVSFQSYMIRLSCWSLIP